MILNFWVAMKALKTQEINYLKPLTYFGGMETYTIELIKKYLNVNGLLLPKRRHS